MKRTILYCVTSSILLFVISFYFIDAIFDFFFSFFKEEHLQFDVQEPSGPFHGALKVSLSIGIIPLLLLIAWIAGCITASGRRVLSGLIVTVCIWLSIMVNVFRIQTHEMVMTALPARVSFPFEKLFFEYAICIGAISGAAVSYFILRKRKGREELKQEIQAIGTNL